MCRGYPRFLRWQLFGHRHKKVEVQPEVGGAFAAAPATGGNPAALLDQFAPTVGQRVSGGQAPYISICLTLLMWGVTLFIMALSSR